MKWYDWVILGIFVAALVVDWFIVMGANPKHWKGGKKDGKL